MRYLTKDQLRRLLEAARKADPVEHLMFLISYWHGLRSTEAVNLWKGKTTARIPTIKDGKPSSIPVPYIESDHIIAYRLKGSKLTRQPLVSSSDPLFDEASLIAALPDGRMFGGWTRHDFNNAMRRYGHIGIIPKFLAHPHVLKRSIGKHMIKQAGLADTSTYLGHKNWNSTKVYVESSDSEASEAMKRAIEEAA
jgi:integrase